ncbi:RHS repeat-associated core domain-containing protein [Vibrio nitrifigilis]|uniref:RHS repeat-associated core domain-containing protein n=1 Tax=Vibrio nitrifigilis TaxID=2789781 RepID=UPI0038B51C4D
MKPDGSSQRFTYNGYGKVTSVEDEKGLITTYEYFENSHLVSKVINPDGSSLSYRYENAKNFVSHITNERGETYQIDYLPNGLVSKETTFDGRSLAYTYDLNGKLLSKVETGTNGTELETVFERDSLGRLLVKTLPDGSKIEYQYDKNGNLISVDDGETPLAWRYDIMDRVIESHAGWSSQYYEYDELGLLSKWQLPDANVLEYQRGKGGVLRAINLNDEVLTQHIFQNGLEMMRNQGELKSHFNYDDQGRLVNQSQMLEGREKQRRQYQYDGLGNLVQISDKQRGDTFYDYDPLSRLTAVRGNLDEQFTHDATGNLIPNHISLQSSELFDHAPGNQLKLHGDSHYEYDEFGRLVKESRGKNQSLVTGYEYDCQHRLIKVTMPDGSQAHYRYDAFGRRIEKRVIDKTGLETTTEFLWQGDNLIAEMTNSEQYQSYVYEPGSFRPLALLKGEGKEAEVYHYHLDQIGTPLDITTTQGETVWSVQYRAYGNVFKKTVAEIESPLRFQGQYFDAETGLHYNRHRYYNPNAGRFITIDPIGLAGGLNNYQYVPNPTGWVDPLGLKNKKGGCPCEHMPPEKYKEYLSRQRDKERKAFNLSNTILEHDSHGNEILYRSMPKEHLEYLGDTGELLPTTETSTSPLREYASSYDGYLVKFYLEPGTSKKLQDIGISADKATEKLLPNVPYREGNWNQKHARFKKEKGQITTALGVGEGLKLFNSKMIRYEVLDK